MATDWKDAIARRVFDALRPIIAEIVRDEIAGRYHPEFGTEWRDPDGGLYKLFHACEQAAFERGRDSVLMARKRR